MMMSCVLYRLSSWHFYKWTNLSNVSNNVSNIVSRHINFKLDVCNGFNPVQRLHVSHYKSVAVVTKTLIVDLNHVVFWHLHDGFLITNSTFFIVHGLIITELCKGITLCLFKLFVSFSWWLESHEDAIEKWDKAAEKNKEADENNHYYTPRRQGTTRTWLLVISVVFVIKVIPITVIVNSIFQWWVVSNRCVKASWLVINL